MKKSHKLLTSLCVGLLAVGAGVALSSVSKVEVKEAEAATAVTVAGSFTGWSQTDTYLSGDYYTYARDFALNDTFKVVNGDTWIGANWNGVTKADGIVDDNTNDHNFKVSKPGKYLIKVNKGIGSYGEKGYAVSVEKYNGRIIVGSFGNWDAATGVVMQHNGGEWSGTVELDYGNELKIPHFTGSSLSYETGIDDYSAVTPNAAAYKYFGNNGGNIKCYAAGSYTFYFSDGNYDSKYKISIAYNGELTAQHLAAHLMGADTSTGTCADRFPAMKTMYLGLTSDEQKNFRGYESSEIDQFKNAYDRYVAWARALGEKPWEEGKVSSANAIFKSVNTSNSAVIIIICSVIAIGSISGFFYYRKRRHN